MFGCELYLILTSASVTAESLQTQKHMDVFYYSPRTETSRKDWRSRFNFRRSGLVERSVFVSVRVCACTHVESGSLSLLPRPGILKAFVRLFFPPSGAKAVMYSSKPTRAAQIRQIDMSKKHKHMQGPSLCVAFCHCKWFCLHDTFLSVGVFIFLLLCKLLKLCFSFTPARNEPKICPVELTLPGLSLPVPFCSANFLMRLSMPMFSTFCLNSSWTCSRAEQTDYLVIWLTGCNDASSFRYES